DRARHEPDGGCSRARSRVAHRHGRGRDARARARAPPRAQRPHARALSAVVRVRLARGLRGDAFGRTGLDRLRRDREDGRGGAHELAQRPQPASAAGPSLRQLLIGSEGTLGVISELALRVRPAPRERIYEGVFFESFAAGARALRELIQGGAAPEVARLSDEAETRMSLALAGTGGAKGRLGRLYLRARGYDEGCVAILGYEGEHASARRERGIAIARESGGLAVGRSPGEAWLKGRFAAPYLRDELLTLGVMVETLETATQWSNVERLHGAVSRAIAGALRDFGTPGLVMCHISHLYETGASLYFTFLARQREGEELAQWRLAKEAASRAICEGGGTITHHHAVGRDHAPWMDAEVGEGGLRALRAV